MTSPLRLECLVVTIETVLNDDGTTTIAYTRDPAGRLLSADGPAEPSWFFTDGLGSVVGIGDSDGAIGAAVGSRSRSWSKRWANSQSERLPEFEVRA